MGTITCTLANQSPASDGSLTRVDAKVAFGTSYNNTGNDATTGETLSAKTFGLSQIKSVVFDQLAGSGYGFEILGDNPSGSESVRVKVYASAGGAGVTGASSPGNSDMVNLSQSSVLSTIRIYVGSVVGAPAPGDVVTGGTSTETANVTAVVGDAGYITVTAPSGAFTTGENLSFAPSGATATMLGNLVDAWVFLPALDGNDIILACNNQNGDGLVRAAAVFGSTQDLSTGQYRFFRTIQSLETNHADGWSQVVIEGTQDQVTPETTHTHTISAGLSGEVPNGTNLNAAGLTAVNAIVYGY